MQLLIWKDKQGDLIYEFDTADQKREAVLDIIERRLNQGYFFDDSEDRSSKILASEDFEEGMRFLRDRRDYEYEGVQTTSTIDTSK